MTGRLSYADAGVDIAAGDAAVADIAPLAASTYRPEVLAGVGAFASAVALPAGYRDPVLVTANDGAGTKPLVAAAMGCYDTIGLDVVAMCVDDLATTGAEPLLFQDQVTMGSVDPAIVRDLVAGLVAGCEAAGCSLTGGEIAEHPGAMVAGAFDICGFAVGVVEREELRGQLSADAVGATLVGLASGGIRCNGLSLARRALLGDAAELSCAEHVERLGATLRDVVERLAARPFREAVCDTEALDQTVGEALLEPSVIYAPLVRRLFAEAGALGAAHITGGGLAANLARILGADVDAVVSRGSWPRPAVFSAIAAAGGIASDEMERVFNLGVGMVVVVPPHAAREAVELAHRCGTDAWVIGKVSHGTGQVALT